MQSTVTYIRQMADELAKLAISAGCRQLFALLTLASIEAQTCALGELPVDQLLFPTVKKSDDALLQAPNLAT